MAAQQVSHAISPLSTATCVSWIPSPARLTAVTLSFNVTNSTPGAQAIFGPVSTFFNPSGSLLVSNANFGAGGIGPLTAPNQVQMQLEPIPEPSTTLLLMAGAGAFAAMQRRQT